jgi:catechol-2,3-dioxygenase
MSHLTRGLCELTLQTPDPEALAAFYRDALGFEELDREDDRIWLACGPNTRLGLWSPGEKESNTRLGLWSPGEKEFGDQGGAHVHYAYSVTRGALTQIVERLTRLGVEHKGPVEHDGGDLSLYFEDPEGNLVEAWDFFEDGDGEQEGVDALAA